MAKKATCPSCGAMGEEGKECEFCGTLITPKVKKASKKKTTKTSKKETEENESSDFSWEDWRKVCPALYKISASKVTGNNPDVSYMVVENQNDNGYQGIIDREGKFVMGPEHILLVKLFSDNNECIWTNWGKVAGSYRLTVLATGEEFDLGIVKIDFKTSELIDENFRYLVLTERCEDSSGWWRWTAFFDRLNKKFIKFSEPAYYFDPYSSVKPQYKLLEKTTTTNYPQFIFSYGSGDKMTITIENGRAFVNGAQKRYKTLSEQIKEDSDNSIKIQNALVRGSLIIFAIIMVIMLCWFVYKMKQLGSEYSAPWYLE